MSGSQAYLFQKPVAACLRKVRASLGFRFPCASFESPVGRSPSRCQQVCCSRGPKKKSNVNILSCGAVTTCSVGHFAFTRKPSRSNAVESEAMSFSRLAPVARCQICAFCDAGWTRPQIAARVRNSDNTPCPVKTVHIRICTLRFFSYMVGTVGTVWRPEWGLS